MGCLKLIYYNEAEALDSFRKNLKVVYAKRGFSEKKGFNYSTFGSLMPGRWSGTDYRFGYNTQEKTDEIKGVGNDIGLVFCRIEIISENNGKGSPVVSKMVQL